MNTVDSKSSARDFVASIAAERRCGSIGDLDEFTCRDESPLRPEAAGTKDVPLPVAVLEVVDEPNPRGALGIVELILKNRPRLESLIRREPLQAELVPRLLGISLASFVLFGAALAIVLRAAGTWPALGSIADWIDGRAPLLRFEADAGGVAPFARGGGALVAAYTLGLIAASGICLPSLYFYGLLAGVKMSFVDVTIHSLKAKATAAIALVGILPMYAALALGMVIFDAPPPLRNACLLVGMALPFVAGLWGTRSLYVGFTGLCDTMNPEFRERRACFLRRLVFSWSAVYTAVAPVMIFTLWRLFQDA